MASAAGREGLGARVRHRGRFSLHRPAARRPPRRARVRLTPNPAQVRGRQSRAPCHRPRHRSRSARPRPVVQRRSSMSCSTRAVPTGRVSSPGPMAKPVRAWRADLGCHVGQRAPVLASGLLLVGCDEPRLFAIDARTGRIEWSVALPGAVLGSAAVQGDRIFVSMGEGGVEGRNLTDGSVLWHVDVPGGPNPAISDGHLYVGASDGRFVGMNLDDGSTTFETRAPAPAGTVVGDTAFVTGGDGSMHAVSLTDGSERWTFAFGCRRLARPQSPTTRSWFQPCSQVPIRKASSTRSTWPPGALRWSKRTPTGTRLGPPEIADGVVYAGSQDSGLYAFDLATGAQRWNVPASTVFVRLLGIAGGALYGTSEDRTLYGVRSSDERLWDLSLDGDVKASPVVSRSSIMFIGDFAGHFDAYAEPALASALAGPTSPPPSANPAPSEIPSPFGAVAEVDAPPWA